MLLMKSVVRLVTATSAVAALLLGGAPQAQACGGFFCSRTPVDQTAERIIFTVNADSTVSAHIQVSYLGDRDNFAWIVPVPGEVAPEAFPQRALTALDLATEPVYQTNSCSFPDFAAAPGNGAGGAASAPPMAGGEVVVLQEQNFGPYQSVTIQGDNAERLVEWLRENGYRITDTMVPYIEQYVQDQMVFFAMRLLPEADVEDISPVKLTYAGSEPMIPIRLTTVAAQPEMGLVVWVLGENRYAPKNYADLAIDETQIEFRNYGSQNNYLTLVSKEVDKVGGQAFITEYAGPTGPLADQVAQGFVPPGIEGAQEAQDSLVALLRAHPHITRLYSRMSAEEMTEDPYFQLADKTESVSNIHNLSCEEGTSASCDCADGSVGTRHCGAPDFGWYGACECGSDIMEGTPDGGMSGAAAPNYCGELPPSPCAFTYCGRSGSCVANDAGQPVCVCAVGTTARARNTTAGELQLYCEPLEFNFMVLPEMTAPNAGAPMFPDACTGFDCGASGACTTMNGSPTCVCEAGFGASVTTEFKDGLPQAKITCERVTGVTPLLPLLPNIGETEIDPGAPQMPAQPGPMTGPMTEPPGNVPAPGNGSTAANKGSCSVAQAGTSSDVPAWLLCLGMAGLLGLRRRRS